MSETPISSHIAKTYAAARGGLAYLAFGFPLVLLIGGYFLAKLPLQDSMSAYYHAGGGVMRNWFVGLLFALGINLFLHKGFTPAENNALNLAGVMALGVALFPMAWKGFEAVDLTVWTIEFSLHGFCAVALFLCIGYVSIFRACDTVDLVKDKKRRERYAMIYKCLGWAMVASPVAAFILSNVTDSRNTLIYFIELAGVWVFAAFWLIKRHEIAETNADGKAARGELAIEAGSRSGLFRRAPIQEITATDEGAEQSSR